MNSHARKHAAPASGARAKESDCATRTSQHLGSVTRMCMFGARAGTRVVGARAGRLGNPCCFHRQLRSETFGGYEPTRFALMEVGPAPPGHSGKLRPRMPERKWNTTAAGIPNLGTCGHGPAATEVRHLSGGGGGRPPTVKPPGRVASPRYTRKQNGIAQTARLRGSFQRADYPRTHRTHSLSSKSRASQ